MSEAAPPTVRQVYFHLNAKHEKAVESRLKERWPDVQIGWTYSLPIYFLVTFEEQIEPFALRDFIAEIAPEVNSEMGAVIRIGNGFVQLAPNPATRRH